MSNYQVSARKYRPVTFDSVVGQSALTTTLKNSIKSGRLAHAYLFCGPRGVGKTTCARIFAKTINCLHPDPVTGNACEECESCKAFNEQRSYNIHELDAASNNGVEDIRQLIEQVNIPPQIGKYKVFIIDEVHMLSTAAFNAFLKTLEEPPAHAIFILATTEKHKLLATILSRCQIYDFNRMTVQDIVGHLQRVAEQEGITYENEALNVIAQKADGGMRDALSIFDQVASFCQGNITYKQTIDDLNVLDYEYYFRLVDYFSENKIPEIILTLNEIMSRGFDAQHFIGGLNTHLRNLLISRDESTVKLLETSDDVRQRYIEQSKRLQPRFIYAAIRKCTDCDLSYRQSQNKRLLVELTLIEIAQCASGTDDALPSGRRPTKNILKPIFSALTSAKAETKESATSQAQTPSQTQVTTQQTTKVQAQPQVKPQISVRPQARPVVSHLQSSSFSIKAQAQNQAPSAAPSHSVFTNTSSGANIKAPANLRLTQDSLEDQWLNYADMLPIEDTALAQRMRNIEPVLNGDTICLTVENKNSEAQFRQVSMQITDWFRKLFNNPSLTLAITVNVPTESKVLLSKGEQYKIMCKENSALEKLREAFDLIIG